MPPERTVDSYPNMDPSDSTTQTMVDSNLATAQAASKKAQEQNWLDTATGGPEGDAIVAPSTKAWQDAKSRGKQFGAGPEEGDSRSSEEAGPITSEVVLPKGSPAGATLGKYAGLQKRADNPVSQATQDDVAGTALKLGVAQAANAAIGGSSDWTNPVDPRMAAAAQFDGQEVPTKALQEAIAWHRSQPNAPPIPILHPEVINQLLDNHARAKSQQEIQEAEQAAYQANPEGYPIQKRDELKAWAEQNGMGNLFPGHYNKLGANTPPPDSGAVLGEAAQSGGKAKPEVSGFTGRPLPRSASVQTDPRPGQPSPVPGKAASSGLKEAATSGKAPSPTPPPKVSAPTEFVGPKKPSPMTPEKSSVQASYEGASPSMKENMRDTNSKRAVGDQPTGGPGVVERVLSSGPNAEVNSMRNWPDSSKPAPEKAPNTFPQAHLSDFIPKIKRLGGILPPSGDVEPLGPQGIAKK